MRSIATVCTRLKKSINIDMYPVWMPDDGLKTIIANFDLAISKSIRISLPHAMRPGLQIRLFEVAKSLITFNQKKQDKPFCS